jgi:PTS system nitrogen regulatory IIA component
MELADIVSVDAIQASAKASSKKRLIQDISALAADVYSLPEHQIFEALQERELLGPTGMGRGVAIPHARIVEAKTVFGLFSRLEKPVDFEAVDGQPVDLVFTLLAPENSGADHLKALARVSRTLRDSAICAKLRSTDEAAALFSILTDSQQPQAA